ncbi:MULTISPECIES: hypothetical protein [unclassified Halomonas]|uniref:hypothetical protein n=1 Tax=unclassified Halomonas TaxID=2609666 RepID=UPI0020A00C7E|nr:MULTISPECIES: hypothetical protein [unclassified Halomonas]MCP1313014.1 hypothetical protein [Halomonas sp. 707D7]MCP1326086.1 hypothetical protein [Halomonas sp. 707D4]
MTQPTHTHREHGGKYAELAQHQGAGALEGQWLVIYEDLDKGIQSGTTQGDWLEQWRPLERDDCPLCLGTGTDPIKGDKSKPCGHCYGLGKVMDTGERPTDQWELAEVSTGIIQRQRAELAQLRAIADHPGVRELVERELQQRIDESIALQEQEWRGKPGHGHGGQRHTGD